MGLGVWEARGEMGGGREGGGQALVVDKFSFNRISPRSVLYSLTRSLPQDGEAIETERESVCGRKERF